SPARRRLARAMMSHADGFRSQFFSENRPRSTGEMRMDRREFVNRSALGAGALILNAARGTSNVWAAAASPTEDLLSHMSWMNEPESAKITGSEITVRSRA